MSGVPVGARRVLPVGMRVRYMSETLVVPVYSCDGMFAKEEEPDNVSDSSLRPSWPSGRVRTAPSMPG